MVSGARRLALQQMERRDDAPELPQATVTAVTVGGGTDGQDLVTVDYLGSSLQLPHLDSYSPAVADRVVIVRVGGLLTILGRPVGFPAVTS